MSTTHLKKQLLRNVYYNKWAHNQIAIFCQTNFKNNPEFYTKNMNLPFSSIRNTLCHLWFAEQIWFSRICGSTHRDLVLPKKMPRTIDMFEFATYWNDQHQNGGNFEKFFDKIDNDLIFIALSKSSDNWIELVEVQNDDNELIQEFKYFDTSNNRQISIKSDVINHIVNHSTHHRGQISGIVRQLISKDIKPIELDFTFWLKLNEHTLHHTKPNNYLKPNT